MFYRYTVEIVEIGVIFSIDLLVEDCVQVQTQTHILTVAVALVLTWLQEFNKLYVDVNLHPQDQTHLDQHQLELADT